VCGHAHDDSADPRLAEEEAIVRGQLDELSRYAAHPPIGSVSHRITHESRLAKIGRRYTGQQMCGQWRDGPHGIVELLGVWPGKLEDDAPVAFRRHRCDPVQRLRQPWSKSGIAGALEGEDDIAGCDGDAVLPLRPLIEIEGERHRVAS